MSLPTVIGLCSDERCAQEFYMPDPKPGEGCPYCDRKLVHYKRTTYRLENPMRPAPDPIATVGFSGGTRDQ